MIMKIEIENYGMSMQRSIANQLDMVLYDKIINILKTPRNDFMIKTIQNETEQIVKKCYIR